MDPSNESQDTVVAQKNESKLEADAVEAKADAVTVKTDVVAAKTDDVAAKAAAFEARKASMMARFEAAKKVVAQGRVENRKEAEKEAARFAADPTLMNSLNRKHAFASHKLLEAETTAAGEDFERKRAWDWTAEESEKWDKRMEKKAKHRDNVAFQDYREEARKSYKKELKGIKPDLEAYAKQKAEAIELAVQRGDMEMIQREDGEIVAFDKTGTFNTGIDPFAGHDHQPTKEALDRVVADIEKKEQARLKKRRKRNGGDDDGDVTHINQKNKQFNQKLARYYDKYTTEIRDSFERGTAM